MNKTKREIPTDEFITGQEQLIREIAMERKQEEKEAKDLAKQYETQKRINLIHMLICLRLIINLKLKVI